MIYFDINLEIVSPKIKY